MQTERSHDPVQTIRLDRRTKLGIMAALLMENNNVNIDHSARIAVDLALALEASIESRLSNRRPNGSH